jgi:beta-glucosidase-like glycosyl hydrolase
LSHLYIKTNIVPYQDRLGTNIGKTQKRVAFFLREVVVESDAHRALAFETAAASFVLLKNVEATLPLSANKNESESDVVSSKLCVFGARANVTAIGNYANTGTLARYNQTVLGGLQERFGKQASAQARDAYCELHNN